MLTAEDDNNLQRFLLEFHISAIQHENMEKLIIRYKLLQSIYLDTCAFAEDIVLFVNSENNLHKNLDTYMQKIIKRTICF